MYDMHCHMGFITDLEGVVDTLHAEIDAGELRLGVLSCTIAPGKYIQESIRLAGCSFARVALGLHPWRTAEGEVGKDAIDRFCELAPQVRYIGEVGLDYAGIRGKQKRRTRQTEAFERVMDMLAEVEQPKVVSLHVVDATTKVLDMIEERGMRDKHTWIFHWFSGNSDELNRAVEMGCYFSVGTRMIATRKGRAYARTIPLKQLLLETDGPAEAGAAWSADIWVAQLKSALTSIAAMRRFEDPAELEEILDATSLAILEGNQNPTVD